MKNLSERFVTYTDVAYELMLLIVMC